MHLDFQYALNVDIQCGLRDKFSGYANTCSKQSTGITKTFTQKYVLIRSTREIQDLMVTGDAF